MMRISRLKHVDWRYQSTARARLGVTGVMANWRLINQTSVFHLDFHFVHQLRVYHGVLLWIRAMRSCYRRWSAPNSSALIIPEPGATWPS
jgi:hypothetical protein